MNISTVIVTFNRKELLIKCINAVLGQSYLPKTIYIIDNASTDGTEEFLKEKGLHHGQVNGVTIRYERLPKNSGGAGGFHAGMKLAHEDGCDAVWMMDDDGLPDKDCLKNLLPHLDQYDYLSPMVIDIEDEKMMAFEGCSVTDFIKREKDRVVKGRANPFNGILYSNVTEEDWQNEFNKVSNMLKIEEVPEENLASFSDNNDQGRTEGNR